MGGGWWITLLGAAAALCSVGSFVPQVLKIRREGDTRAISVRMYLVLTAGFVLWLGYGVVIGSWPVVVVNVANLALGGTILWLKLRAGKDGDTPAAEPPQGRVVRHDSQPEPAPEAV
jgi:MtN3 and saliva related transmembrane protein